MGGRRESEISLGHGGVGEIEVSADWRSNGQLFVQGTVPVGREVPGPGEGSTGDTGDGALRLEAEKALRAGG